jgi:hypothetical protein
MEDGVDFFSGIPPHRAAGVALLAAGALVTFLSGRISVRFEGRRADLTVKLIGLAAAFAGFILVML